MPALVIMAAGMGSRYGGLKQMDPVGPNGETLLEYSIYDAIKAGFRKVLFIIREDFADEFMEQVSQFFEGIIEVHYVFQELGDLPRGFSVPEGRTKPWGTGQAVLACRGLVKEPFAVQNADDFYGADAYRVMVDALARMSPASSDSYMVGYRLRNTCHRTVPFHEASARPPTAFFPASSSARALEPMQKAPLNTSRATSPPP